MSFFSRKPNPPVPIPVTNALNQTKQYATGGLVSSQGGLSPVAEQNERQAPSNARFRNFAERYVIERCRDWKEGEIDERAWEAILQARSIYNKVKEVGRTVV